MKIAVYAIALNETLFVKQWWESAKEADFLLIADTGSTDDTVEKAKKLGIEVINISIKPWRFDDARNASLAAIPVDIDYCIALDMDEQLQSGWRESLESIDLNVTRPRYKYTWSWNEDGSPGLVYGGDKIHSRNNYRWKHPVHEVLSCTGVENQSWISLEIHHHPDPNKSRSQYLPLLELAVKEDPLDDRNAFYYARELYFNGYKDKAIIEFKRHLGLPKATWQAERAASMRYLSRLEINNQESWLLKAIAEAPNHREARVELSEFYYKTRNWMASLSMALSAIDIKDKPLEYLCESDSWGYLPYDLAAISYYNLGLYEKSLVYGLHAVQLAPYIERLKVNLSFYEEATK